MYAIRSGKMHDIACLLVSVGYTRTRFTTLGGRILPFVGEKNEQYGEYRERQTDRRADSGREGEEGEREREKGKPVTECISLLTAIIHILILLTVWQGPIHL